MVELRWGIEIDGHPDHFTEAGATRDRERDLACDGIGWKVTRMTGASLNRDLETCLDQLIETYHRRRSEFDAMRVHYLPGPHLSSQAGRRWTR